MNKMGVSHYVIFLFNPKIIIFYIYISIVVALDETLHNRCLHFSIQNIEQSCDLACVYIGGLTLTSINDCFCLSVFMWRNYRITMI